MLCHAEHSVARRYTLVNLQGLNYVVSSAFYFEKAAVTAAGMSSAASRTALFAAINGASAAIVGIVQVSVISMWPRSPAHTADSASRYPTHINCKHLQSCPCPTSGYVHWPPTMKSS